MKNNFKRIGAFLLAFVMLIGIMPINAIAKDVDSFTSDGKLIAKNVAKKLNSNSDTWGRYCY